MSTYELPSTFNFRELEPKIYQEWENRGYFRPTNDPNEPGHDPTKKPFVISMPPPNVTGKLHLGHAMFVSLEDLMTRYHRMKGEPTLWVPGTDHAGIATQLMVERDLAAKGIDRKEIGREEFLKHAWAWKERYHDRIVGQIRRLGASCDWTRERFTLDPGLSRAVREAFVRLWKKGLIYRGPRLINWDPNLKTAVSDLEVEYREQQGTLYYFKYMLADGSGYIPVATTRPETILGDTAVAVHPDDDRYKQFVGKEVVVPILGRRIPVIADEYVDPEFGTGALKITPGHDPNDYEIGMRHNLPIINIFDEEGRINENGGPYAGLDRFEARKKLWEDMRAAGLVIKEEPYVHQVPVSERGGTLIEPMISTQWFVKIKPLAEAALQAVREGKIRIIPERFEKVYFHWLENIKDWCISRQLWWGHRIPAWYGPDGEIFVAHDEQEAHAQAEKHYGHPVELTQDPDVLDTWFSSGLWPFSTLGWPEETPDYRYFYPTSVMETGYDILFFWVARMIMMGLEFTGKEPFHTVYLHGLVRDEHGQKMSKTKGNVIDPLVVMDELGTDALRFTLLVGSSPGNDINISLKKVEANRNFANKVWNAGRFVIGALEKAPDRRENEVDWTLADSWIWARLQDLIRRVNRLFDAYQFGEAGRQIYDFFWSEFADWYVEIAKLQLAEGGDRAFTTAQTLVKVLDASLRLLHPFTPFVTEALWGHLKQAVAQRYGAEHPDFTPAGGWPEALIVAPWPESHAPEGWEEGKVAEFSVFQNVVRAIRNLRAEKKVKPGVKIGATIAAGAHAPALQSLAKPLAALARLDPAHLTIAESLSSRPADSVALVADTVEIFLPLADLVDVEEERARLQKELAQTEAQIERLEKLLASPFSEKAPPPVVQKERDKLARAKAQAEKLRKQLQELG